MLSKKILIWLCRRFLLFRVILILVICLVWVISVSISFAESNSSDESESDLLSFVPPIRSRPISEIDHEELPRNKAIFFIESDLNASRSSFLGSCAFESAARQNPKVPIYLLVDSQSQNFGMAPDLVFVHVHFLNFTRLLLSSPLAPYSKHIMANTIHNKQLREDIIKTVILYLKGGIFLAQDLITVKSFPSIFDGNFGTMALGAKIDTGVLILAANHPLLTLVMQEIIESLKDLVFLQIDPFSLVIKSKCFETNSKGDLFNQRDLDLFLASNSIASLTFICPHLWNLGIAPLNLLAIVPSVQWLDYIPIPHEGNDKFEMLFGFHLTDISESTRDEPRRLNDVPKIRHIIETYCPLTKNKTIQED